MGKRRIQILCKEGRVEGAELSVNKWRIPDHSKTKPRGMMMGNDGIIEYTAKDYSVHPECLVKEIRKNIGSFQFVTDHYEKLLLHNEISHCMGYTAASGITHASVTEKEASGFIRSKYEIDFDLSGWINQNFMPVHEAIFKNKGFIEIKNGILKKKEQALPC